MSREQIKADLAILGAGSAGLVTAAGAAMLGRKVVLFEPGAMGGDCLNYGCVPSKAILTAAAKVHAVRKAGDWGIETSDPKVDFAKVREHIARAIAAIEPNDSQERFEGLGVRVIREYARFEGERTVGSDSVEVQAKRIVIATGARARIPNIEGLADAPPVAPAASDHTGRGTDWCGAGAGVSASGVRGHDHRSGRSACPCGARTGSLGH